MINNNKLFLYYMQISTNALKEFIHVELSNVLIFWEVINVDVQLVMNSMKRFE